MRSKTTRIVSIFMVVILVLGNMAIFAEGTKAAEMELAFEWNDEDDFDQEFEESIESEEPIEFEETVEMAPYYASTVIESGTCGDNAVWSLDDGGVLTISGFGRMYDYEPETTPPWPGTQVFSVVIEQGITSIGNGAFRSLPFLEEVEIADTVDVIGRYAFEDCDSLMTVTVPDSVISIGQRVFSNCDSLNTVYLSDQLQVIPAFLFSNCSSLWNITIPESVTEIQDYAFVGCIGLPAVYIPASVSSIGIGVFADCSILDVIEVSEDNPVFDSREGCNAIIETSENRIMVGCKTTLIPDGIESIADEAFQGCVDLDNITIPETVTCIGVDSFLRCNNLDYVAYLGTETQWRSMTILPGNDCLTCAPRLQFLGENHIYEGICGDNVTWQLDVDDSGTLRIFGFGEIYDYKQWEAPWYELRENIEKIVIASGITTIGNWNFYGCHNATFIDIPDGVTSIGNHAFDGCESVEYIDLPETLVDIGEAAFYFCRNLIEIVIPDGVQIIRNDTFGCDVKLEKVTLPSHLVSIGQEAFSPCFQLKDIDMPDTVVSIGEGAFSSTAICNLILPQNIEYIGSEAFVYCNITSVFIPAHCTYIGNNAFSGANLSQIEVDKNNPVYDSRDNCNAIIESVSNKLICGCMGTIVPDTVEVIGENSFKWCKGLVTLEIPEGVTSIERNAFYECTDLISLTLPSSIIEIGEDVFTYSRLSIIYYNGTIEEWEKVEKGYHWNGELENATVHCDFINEGKLASGKCGDQVTYSLNEDGLLEITGTGSMYDFIDSDAPWDSYSDKIKIAIINEGVTTLGAFSFYQKPFLEKVSLPNSLLEIHRGALAECPMINSLTIPENVTLISCGAILRCDNLSSLTYNARNCQIVEYHSEGYGVSYSFMVVPSNSYYWGTAEDTSFRGVKELTIGEGVNNIPYYALGNFNNLQILHYNATNATISGEGSSIQETFSYSHMNTLKVLEIGEGVQGIPDCLCRYNLYITHVVFPNSIQSIGKASFYGTSLEAVNVSSGLIDDYAFESISTLEEVKLGTGVSYIGHSAFEDCSNLKTLTISEGLVEIQSDSFLNCNQLEHISLPASLSTIHSYWGTPVFSSPKLISAGPAGSGCSIEFSWKDSIPDNAFVGCEYLTQISLPDSVKLIGSQAFYNCRSLSDFEFPKQLTSIGNSAFYGCRSLTDVILPGSVKSIGASAFEGCTGLNKVVLPNSLLSVGGGAFYGCDLLKTIGPDDSDCNILIGWNRLIPSDSLCSFEYCESITIPDGVQEIGNYAFGNHTIGWKDGEYIWRDKPLREVTIPISVKQIDYSAFEHCENITDVYYKGTKSQWDEIVIESGNEYLVNANIHFEDVATDFGFNHTDFSGHLLQPVAVIEGTDASISGWISFSELLDEQKAFSGITWTSSDPSIATIDTTEYHSGIFTDITSLSWTLFVKGLKPGKVTITGTASDGRTAVSPEITIEPKLNLTDYEDEIVILTEVPICKIVLPSGDADYLNSFLPTLAISMDNTKADIADIQYDVSSDGKTGTIICSICPKAIGTLIYTVTSPGKQSLNGTLKLNYYNELIYRAAFLNTNEAPAMNIQDCLTDDTPSKMLLDAGADNGVKGSIAAWEGVTALLDAYNDPGSVVEKVIKPVDVYKGIILKILEASMSIDLVNDMYEDAIDQVETIIKNVNKSGEFLYIMNDDLSNCKNWSESYKSTYLKGMHKYYQKSQSDLTDLGSVFEGMTTAFDLVNDVESFAQLLASYITIANMNGYMREVLTQAYYESQKTDNVYLKEAFQECMNVLNDGVVTSLINEQGFAIGRNVAGYLFKEIVWNDIKAALPIEVQIIMLTYGPSKAITNFLFNTDDIVKSYHAIQAAYDIEEIFKTVNITMQSNFMANPT